MSSSIDYYAIMPPLELFMGVSAQNRKDQFFKHVGKGDILVGKVAHKSEHGFLITLLCMDAGKRRFISDLDIRVFCPYSHCQQLAVHAKIHERYQVGDCVRVVVTNYTPEHTKIVVSMKEEALPLETRGVIKMGLISEEEFPMHYIKQLKSENTSYNDVLKKSLGFNNPGATEYLCSKLKLPTTDRLSLIEDVQRKKIPKNFAKKLRLAQSEDWARTSLCEGIKYMKEGKLIEASQLFNKSLQIYPEYVEALVARGCLFSNNGKMTKALEDFDRALELNPNHQNARNYMSETLVALGKIYEDKGDLDNASKSFKKAIQINIHNDNAKQCLDAVDARNTGSKITQEEASHYKTNKEIKKEKPDDKPLSDTKEKLKYLLDESKKHKSGKRKKKNRSSSSSSNESSSEVSSNSSSDSSTSSSSSSEESDDESKHKRRRKKKKKRKVKKLKIKKEKRRKEKKKKERERKSSKKKRSRDKVQEPGSEPEISILSPPVVKAKEEPKSPKREIKLKEEKMPTIGMIPMMKPNFKTQTVVNINKVAPVKPPHGSMLPHTHINFALKKEETSKPMAGIIPIIASQQSSATFQPVYPQSHMYNRFQEEKPKIFHAPSGFGMKSASRSPSPKKFIPKNRSPLRMYLPGISRSRSRSRSRDRRPRSPNYRFRRSRSRSRSRSPYKRNRSRSPFGNRRRSRSRSRSRGRYQGYSGGSRGYYRGSRGSYKGGRGRDRDRDGEDWSPTISHAPDPQFLQKRKQQKFLRSVKEAKKIEEMLRRDEEREALLMQAADPALREKPTYDDLEGFLQDLKKNKTGTDGNI